MERVVVTGGSGKLGRAVVRDLLEHGYDVINLDVVPSRDGLGRFIQTDVEDMGQVIETMSQVDDVYKGIDAVVHLAAIPAPGKLPNGRLFRTNIISTFNVFETARRLGIRNVVWASSETVLGLPFDKPPPYIPVDEEYRGRPETVYSLSKHLGEEMAREYCRWDPAMKIISLRFSNVMEPEDYQCFPSFEENKGGRKWNLWAYIDARDGAQAVRKSLEFGTSGAETFIIANADGVMTTPNDELIAAYYPGVSHKVGRHPNETLLSIEKARAMLGYEPQFSWRQP